MIKQLDEANHHESEKAEISVPYDVRTPVSVKDAGLASALRRFKSEIARIWSAHHSENALLHGIVSDQLGGWDRYRSVYLEPMIMTLAAGYRRGVPELIHTYCYERIRYLSPTTFAEGGLDALEAILRRDLDDVAVTLEGSEVDPKPLVEALEGLHQSILASAKSSTAVKLALIGDCLLTELSSFVIPSAQSCDVPVQVTQFYFSASQSGAFAPDEILRAISDSKFDVIGMSFLTFEGLPPYTALMAQADSLASDEIVRRVDQIVSVIREYINQVRASTDAPIVLHGCCGLPLSKARAAIPFLQPISRGRQRAASLFNERLLELAEHIENMVFLNEEAIVSKFGYRAADRRLLPRRSTYRALFHPSTLGKLLYPTYLDVVRTHDRLGKMKVLLVDFDNTLWDGVMAEGDVTHNEQGQQLLKSLKDAGILLVSVSKNDPASIRWNEMRLTPDDFVLNKISWSSKAASIKEAAQQLDLGLDSFVFLDDNPAERFMVGKALPEVRALDPADPFTWRALELALALPNTRGTEEARRRTEIYREAADRREALAGPIDYAALMAGLGLRVNFGMVGPDELDRAHELLSRTNQFNTTTLRLTRAELGSFLREPDRRGYVATLEDRFGKLGIVGLVLVTIAQSTLIFDDVVMSCRAMGFGLEGVLIRGPFELDPQLQRARGQFVRTERNSPCASLFMDSGFRSDDNGWWTLESEKGLPQIPDWLDVTFR